MSDKELDDLYMVIGALLFMAEALKKTGTVAHAEKAKQYEALAKHYDTRFVMGINEVSLAAPQPSQEIVKKRAQREENQERQP